MGGRKCERRDVTHHHRRAAPPAFRGRFELIGLPKLDRTSPDYPFDVLTLCEAIVEDPDAILRRQVDKLKTEKVEEMRAAGASYEERMEKLEEIASTPGLDAIYIGPTDLALALLEVEVRDAAGNHGAPGCGVGLPAWTLKLVIVLAALTLPLGITRGRPGPPATPG